MESLSTNELAEIALVGDLTDHEGRNYSQIARNSRHGGESSCISARPAAVHVAACRSCRCYCCAGCAPTGIVTGECSSAAAMTPLRPTRSLVTPYSVLLFHPMKWQSEEHVGLAEAAEWARHFGHLETEMDQVLAGLLGISAGRDQPLDEPGPVYRADASWPQAGLAELVEYQDAGHVPTERPSAGAETRAGPLKNSATLAPALAPLPAA